MLPIKAEVMLVIPHSNTELERLLNIVRKPKYNTRSSPKIDGASSSILAMKPKYPKTCFPARFSYDQMCYNKSS